MEKTDAYVWLRTIRVRGRADLNVCIIAKITPSKSTKKDTKTLQFNITSRKKLVNGVVLK